MKKESQSFKRVLSFLMALAMVLSLIPVTAFAAETPTKLYLKPNANWLVDNARFAAYFFGNGETWVSMTDEDSDGVYEVEVPTGYPSVIFCRMNPSATDNNWNNKWNQTADLTVPTDGTNCYTVADGAWDKGSGTWSIYTPPTYTIAGTISAAGWSPENGEKLTDEDSDGIYTYTYTNVAAGSYEFKVTNGTWDNAWPGSNYALTVAEDGSTVTITFDASSKAVNATVTAPTPTEPSDPSEPSEEEGESETITVYFRNDWLWPEVYVHYWNDSQGTTWPGEKMTKVGTDSNYDVYSAEIPTWATGLLFNGIENGKSGEDYRQQTPNVTGFADGDAYYIHYDGENKCSKFTYTPSTGEGGESGGETTTPVEATYIVAGTAGLCGTAWTPSDTTNKMTLGEDGLYTITYESVKPGDHAFKVTDGTWDNCWGGSGSNADTDGNYAFTLEAISDVTITFNADTKAITVTTEATGETLETANYKVTLHFANTVNWNPVNLYTWTDGGTSNGEWPGSAVSMGTDGYYTDTVEYEYYKGEGLNFIFNNGSAQTIDLELAADAFTETDGVYTAEKWVVLTTKTDDNYNAAIVDSAEAIVTSPVVSDNSVTFNYGDSSAKSVAVAGSFNSWSATANPMTNTDGVWSTTIEDLEAGDYQYKFVVDDNWILDPMNGNVVTESDDNQNSAFYILSSADTEDTNKVTINVHYTRTDGNYENWNLWVWGNALSSHQVDFAEELVDGAKVATIVLEDARAHTSVSFKERKSVDGNDWADEGSSDRTIDLSTIVSGTIDYYIPSGNCVYGDNVVRKNKVSSVALDYDTGVLTLTTAQQIADPSTEVTLVKIDGDDEATVEATVNSVGTTCVLTRNGDEAWDLTTLYQYKIKYQGFTYDISIDDVYASDKFAEEYTYAGEDLGATWSSDSTTFKVWAPTAEAVSVKLYDIQSDKTYKARETTYAMTAGANGTWAVTIEGNLNGVYYNYLVTVDGEVAEAVDPYARTTGVNGTIGMVINLDSTDPTGWASDTNPNQLTSYTDAVIYELHVRDFSIDDSSGMTNKGKYLAFTEEGTKTSGGVTTGIDYLDDLGVTHVHLLPVYDYGSVDETKCENFNWGYDPVNYNTPEGSYSTDPYNGATRVSEFKQMVKSLHDHDISVIMDVVYNHVYDADKFCFNNIVPGYFSRVDSNRSGCGNDTASEREMVRKYIVESVLYWHQEYHIDGFRFDLVGLLDVETINEIVKTVHACCPDVIFYGEGWDMDSTNKEPGTVMAKQGNASKTPGFAYFSDSMRDLLAGNAGNPSLGFVSGASGKESSIVSNFMANPGWTSNPTQVVQYASCHDNYTLIDRILLSLNKDDATDATIMAMNNLAATIYMTSQGISFIHAGEEILREKVNADGSRNHNSYNSSDAVNSINWDNLEDSDYADTYTYYKGLIEFRKAHAALRYDTAAEVSANVKNKLASGNLVAFQIDGNAAGDDDIYVIFNANSSAKTVTLPAGTWTININKDNAGTTSLGTASGSVSVDGISAMVLTKADEGKDSESSSGKVTVYFTNNKNWSNVYAYAWEGTTFPLGAWPGSTMTFVETNDYGQDVYCIEVSASAEGIIFNNNAGSQTVNLTVPADGMGYYCSDTTDSEGHYEGVSYKFRDPVSGSIGEADEYFLFGWINNADCADDTYKFNEDGTLTATFETDSYVYVVNGDYSEKYMTQGWLGSVTSATLYDVAGQTDLSAYDKLIVPGGVEVTFTLTVNDDSTVTLSYVTKKDTTSYSATDTSGIQDGVTLHCWNWSFAEIEKNMATIAEQGYTAIQTSPVQPIKESTTASTVGTHWWVYYQPVNFVITTDEGNALGTKAELISMINTAHQYGIKVIVDVVANHLANNTGNDLSTAIPEDIRTNTNYWHDIATDISDWSDRKNMTQYCMSGLPDLNTANDDVQNMVLNFLKECIDAGVDGFRFDAAKSIETPEDDSTFASDFWPTVVGGAEEYAESKGKDIYCYGETLDTWNGLAVSAYTDYMAITDNSWGNTLRGNIASGTAALSAGYNKAANASQLVIWAESHDTYADNSSSGVTEANINKTWALVAARADAMGLYLARPASTTQLLGTASVTGWANDEVKAVNEFHKLFAGQSETISNENGVSYVERGTSGVVLVNASGTTAWVNVTANAMADGTYTDQITGNTFNVADGKISGTIGSTGIAVVYDAKEANAVAQNTNTGVKYETVSEALKAAKSDETVILLKDVEEKNIIIPAGVTLNLQSYTLTASYVIGVKGSYLTANINSGKLIVDQDKIVLSEKAPTDSGYAVLPIWNEDHYVFSNIGIYDLSPSQGLFIDEANDEIYFQFKHQATTAINQGLFTDGVSDNEVKIAVRVEWTSVTGTASLDFVYSDEHIANVVKNNYDYALTLGGCVEELEIDMSTLKVYGCVISDSGVIATGTVWTQDNAKTK